MVIIVSICIMYYFGWIISLPFFLFIYIPSNHLSRYSILNQWNTHLKLLFKYLNNITKQLWQAIIQVEIGIHSTICLEIWLDTFCLYHYENNFKERWEIMNIILWCLKEPSGKFSVREMNFQWQYDTWSCKYRIGE